MAKLRVALTPEEVRKTGVADIRKAYNNLALDYNRITEGKIYYCHSCGEFHLSDAFYSDSRFASGFFPECKQSLLIQATDYNKETNEYIDNKEKTIEVLKKLDLPYIDSLYKSALTSTQIEEKEKVRKTAYQHMIVILKSLPQYKTMHFENSEFDDEYINVSEEETKIVQRKIKDGKKIFGLGLSNEDYMFLVDNYEEWQLRTQVDSLSQETYIKQICLQLLDIDKDRKSGKDVTNKLKALDTLMNSANLQPRQNVSNAATDSLTFGQLIERWEMEEPIPDPDPEFADVNGIGKLIRVFFSGWLCKALGIKNAYSQECEEYISQYEVVKPTIQEEGTSSDIYDKLFGSDGE